MRVFSNVWRIVCLSALPAMLGWGQSSFTASVRGTITDPSGSAVPSAKVSLIETERNVQHNAITDEAGRYFLTALPPGKYSLAVEAPGFKKFAQTDLILVVQQQATLNVPLQVGDIATTVEVAT